MEHVATLCTKSQILWLTLTEDHFTVFQANIIICSASELLFITQTRSTGYPFLQRQHQARALLYHVAIPTDV